MCFGSYFWVLSLSVLYFLDWVSVYFFLQYFKIFSSLVQSNQILYYVFDAFEWFLYILCVSRDPCLSGDVFSSRLTSLYYWCLYTGLLSVGVSAPDCFYTLFLSKASSYRVFRLSEWFLSFTRKNIERLKMLIFGSIRFGSITIYEKNSLDLFGLKNSSK